MKNKKLAGLIFPEYRFGKTRQEDGLALAKAGVGGFCFYGGSAPEIFETSEALREAAGRPILIAADYEEGAGRRAEGATELFVNMAAGASLNTELAFRKAEITAEETLALGLDWIFAPVTDLACEAENPIVNVRSFGSSPELVSGMAEAFVAGAAGKGVITTLKHFPGHGKTVADSHLSMPVIKDSLKNIFAQDMLPYRKILDKVPSVMLGHLLVPAIDAEKPVSLSEKAVKLLREKLGYGGLIITDALNMNALDEYGEPGVEALRAGADILLYPRDPYSLMEALEKAVADGDIAEARIEKASARIEKLRGYRGNRPRPPFSVLRKKESVEFNSEAAPLCLTWIKKQLSPLKKGDRIYYSEPGKRKETAGAVFKAGLEAEGIKVLPYGEGTPAGSKIIIGIFSGPRAYSGKINLTEEEKTEIDEILKKHREVSAVSFGSPFAVNALTGKLLSALCAYCPIPAFQEYAAKVMTGAAEACGKLPV